MAGLTLMRNLGREMSRKLAAAGIGSPEQLTEMGAEQAYFQLKLRYPEVCLVHLYALEGAIVDIDFNRLPEARKRELKAFSDSLRGRPGGEADG